MSRHFYYQFSEARELAEPSRKQPWMAQLTGTNREGDVTHHAFAWHDGRSPSLLDRSQAQLTEHFVTVVAACCRARCSAHSRLTPIDSSVSDPLPGAGASACQHDVHAYTYAYATTVEAPMLDFRSRRSMTSAGSGHLGCTKAAMSEH